MRLSIIYRIMQIEEGVVEEENTQLAYLLFIENNS